jgi:hypothetical protein
MNCFLITTYKRRESCQKLVDSLQGDIFVLGDGVDYIIKGCEFYNNTQNYSKENYWHTVNCLWKLPEKQYDYYFMIPDDLLPIDGFVEKSIDIWNRILDPQKICLNTFVGQGRLNKACWTDFEPKEYEFYRKTQWVDMCFMAERNFFDAVGTIPKIRHRWEGRPELSSGVGAWISRKLVNNNFVIYQTKTSIFTSQKSAFKSVMNPWRKDNDLHNAVL